MTWVKLDANLPGAPEVVGLSNDAFRLYVESLFWCAHHGTKHIPPEQVQWPLASELTAAGLWRFDRDGWTFRDEHAQVGGSSLDGATALYRLFADNGRLLYVGITNDWERRRRQHASEKPWWRSVAHRTVEWYQTRHAALRAESEAIQTEHPVFNIAGRPKVEG